MKIIRPTAVLDSGVGAFSRASTATYYDSAKVLKTAAVDIPRIGYDPATGTLVGPVIESAATNLLTYSEYWDNVAWVKTACTVGPSTQPALDGTLTADVIAWTGLGNIDRPLTLSGTGTYTFSCFIHTSSTCTSLSVVIYWLGSSIQAAFVAFNPTTGIFISQGSTAGATIIGYTITNVGNGWYRVSVSGTGTNSNNTIVQSQLYNNIASSCKAVVWGGQLETGSTVTSYIPSVETWVARASTATYINSAGLIAIQSSGVARSSYNPLNLTLAPRLLLENAATNLLIYTEHFSDGWWTKVNSSILPNDTLAPDGSITADAWIEATGTNQKYMRTTLATTGPATYTMSCYAKTRSGTRYLVMEFDAGGGEVRRAFFDLASGTVTNNYNGAVGTITLINKGWYRCATTVTMVGAASATYWYISNSSSSITGYAGDGASGIYIWGAQLETGSTATSYIPSTDTWTARASVATYFGSNGLIQTASSGVQRLNYNPTNLTVAPKLLLEAAATNLLTYSEQFDHGNWTKGRASVSSNLVTAPDGLISVEKVIEDTTASNTHYVAQAFSATSGTAYTLTAFLKSGERTCAVLGLEINGFNNYASFDLNSGVVGNVFGTTTSTITPAGNGWYRCSITATCSATNTSYASIFQAAANTYNDRIYTGNGSSGIYLWGAQLEAGSVATSYIQTVGASASRLADTSTSGQTARVADTSSSVTSTRAADVEGAGSFSRATTATYFDAAGVLQTAAINVPRIGYNPSTLAHTGLILEGMSTNVIRNAIAYCAGTSTIASAGTAIGPDGTAATKVIPNAGAISYPGSGDPAAQTFANVQIAGQYTDYTFSGYFAPYGPLNYQPYIVITATSNPGNEVYALVFFDATSGIFYSKSLSGGFSDLIAPTATLMPCGMWLVKWTVRFTQGTLLRTLVYHYIQVANASRSAVYTADGVSGIQRACHQFEIGSTATSYIPTTSAAVTRAADIIVGTGFIYSSLPEGGGTLLTKPETLATQSVTVAATPYTISFTGTGSIVLSGTGSGSLVGTGASNRVSLTFTPTAGTLTITVTGSVTLAQLELGSTLSPYRNETEWNAATNYTVGQQVIRTTSATHKIYENLSAGVDSTFPELLPARWLEVSPTNRWGVFDSQVGTVSTALNSITYLLKPGRINSIAMLEADAALVTLSLVLPTGQVIYASSADLNAGTTVGDWYQYFYEPIYQQDSLVVTNLLDTALLNIPSYAGATLAITLSKPSGTVSCGIIVVGLSADLGSTQRAPSIGIIDYSTKVVDTFGNFTITKRKYSKRMNVKLAVPSNTVDATSRVISQYRSTPLVWVGAENLYTSLIVYGFYRDFDITIDNQIMSTCDIQIEGLT